MDFLMDLKPKAGNFQNRFLVSLDVQHVELCLSVFQARSMSVFTCIGARNISSIPDILYTKIHISVDQGHTIVYSFTRNGRACAHCAKLGAHEFREWCYTEVRACHVTAFWRFVCVILTPIVVPGAKNAAPIQ